MTTCAVSTDLRAHMREVDEADRQAEEVLRRVACYTATSCNPVTTEMVAEALAEISESMVIFIAHHIATAIIERDQCNQDRIYAQLGRQIAAMVRTYSRKEASRIAQREIAVASCPICFDAGCPTCSRHDD